MSVVGFMLEDGEIYLPGFCFMKCLSVHLLAFVYYVSLSMYVELFHMIWYASIEDNKEVRRVQGSKFHSH